MPARLFSTSWATAGAVSQSGTGAAWTASGASLGSDLATSDDVRATAALSGSSKSQNLDCTEFDFWIPSRSDVLGVEARIERSQTGAGTIKDNFVKLLSAGHAIGENKADLVTGWPATDAVKSYGAQTDPWGAVLTPSIVNATDFGLRVSTQNGSPVNPATARIDHLQMRVWYDLPQIVTERVLSDAAGRRVILAVRCDGNGEALWWADPLSNYELCQVRVTPQSATNLFDVTLESEFGDDLLASELLNLSNASPTTVRPFAPTADADESLPLVVPPDAKLKVANAGEDAALVIELLGRPK